TLVRHGDRYYIIDWKSNWLGAAPDAYTPANVRAAMHEHAYTLQYHLYSLALDRYLSRRLPDYDPARHLGGAYYVFLRGLAPAPGTDPIFTDHPSPDLIAKFSSRLLCPF
ncbi:MAG: hypothetical protein ACOCVG_02560, partial [Verrucomicrobiota bacterium]